MAPLRSALKDRGSSHIGSFQQYTKANFEVRSMAMNRYSLSLALRNSVISRWKKPIG